MVQKISKAGTKINVSLIVPYYNEEQTIKSTLKMIESQSYQPKEVILVNSSSTDNTSEIIDKFINDSSYSKIYKNIASNSKTPSSSKNIGIKMAKYEYLAFMDCGLNFQDNWLKKQVERIRSNNFEIISGLCVLKGNSFIDTAIVSQTYGVGTKRACIPGSLIKKSVFNRIGLFLENSRAGYDRAWQKQVLILGVKKYMPEIPNVEYMGVNYANSLLKVFIKTILYSKASASIYDFGLPKIYLSLFVCFVVLTFFSLKLSLFFSIAYGLIRGFVIPFLKSSVYKPLLNFNTFLLLPITGLVYDVSRVIGFVIGLSRNFK